MHVCENLCTGAYYLSVQQSTTSSKKKHSATLPSCSLSRAEVPSISFASSWETSFVTSCTVLVTALYWASMAGNFCLRFWNKGFKKYFSNSTYAFMGDKRPMNDIYSNYALFSSLILVKTGSCFKYMKTEPESISQLTLNAIWNYKERNI